MLVKFVSIFQQHRLRRNNRVNQRAVNYMLMAVVSAAGNVGCRTANVLADATAELKRSTLPISCHAIVGSAVGNESSRAPWGSFKRLNFDGDALVPVTSLTRKPLVKIDTGFGSFVNAVSLRNLNSTGVTNTARVFAWKGRHEGAAASQHTRDRIGVSDSEPDNNIFEVEDPRAHGYPRLGVVDLNQAWEVLWQDVLYLDWRARHDVYAIKSAHDKVVEILNPLAREKNSVTAMREQLRHLQEELSRAHTQVHLSESRVKHSLKKLIELESVINDTLLHSAFSDEKEKLKTIEPIVSPVNHGVVSDPKMTQLDRSFMKKLNVSGPIAPYPTWLKNFWYPVAFTSDVGVDTLVPFESFEEPWVLFRGKQGQAGCVRDECAHRACPLSLGRIVDGQIQCPYHGWEYCTGGECKKMPSTRPLKASIKSLPCIEQDGMVWIWPGDETPSAVLPSLNPPRNFTVHAEIVLELPVEHGLLMENLLDLAHAPFTHTSTFAKGWSVPSFVRFKTPTAALSGNWDPYPIDMEFQPPCMVLSTIGLVKPGQLDGSSTESCPKHLHQLHVCMPSTRGKTRLLYRMALDFAQWAKHVPFIKQLWVYLANQVLNEDLRLVEGQQDRMERGANVWQTPVAYDKLGVRYRRWRNAVEAGNKTLPFDSL